MRLRLADLILIASPLTRVCQLWPRSDGARDYLEHRALHRSASPVIAEACKTGANWEETWSNKNQPQHRSLPHWTWFDRRMSYCMRQHDKSTTENRVTINYTQRNRLEINKLHDHLPCGVWGARAAARHQRRRYQSPACRRHPKGA